MPIGSDIAPPDDSESHTARMLVVSSLGDGLRELGQAVWVAGELFGNDRPSGHSPFDNGSDAVVGIGIVAQTAGELAVGTKLLLDSDNLYSAAALVRQLVEVEYLSWAFAEAPEIAANWLRADRELLKKHWQPRHLRNRSNGKFDGQDYGMHCKLGGHPTRDGAILLPGHHRPQDWLFPLELVTHGANIVRYLQTALKNHWHGNSIDQLQEFQLLCSHIQSWEGADQLPSRLEQKLGQ